jgi:hypothetical protein
MAKQESKQPELVDYYGERVTKKEKEAIEAFTEACEKCTNMSLCPLELDLEKAPRLEYRRKVYKIRAATHNGQSKLFFDLFLLLTRYGHLAKTVLYAGAAPGTNIALAATYFPDHVFYLYDPARFSLNCTDLKDIRGGLVQKRISVVTGKDGYFDDNTAKAWAKRDMPLIFISDIRKSTARDEDFEGEVKENMAAQMRWYEILGNNAKVSMFKFRLPYESEQVKYLAGKVWLQPWAPVTSTETRLVVLGGEVPLVTYDSCKYAEQLFYHNTVVREWGKFPVPGVKSGLLSNDGFDACYDCRRTAAAYEEFVKKFVSPDISTDELVKRVESMIDVQTAHLKQSLLAPPHGKLPGLPIRERRIQLFQFLKESRAKHNKRLKVRKRSRQRARGARRGYG